MKSLLCHVVAGSVLAGELLSRQSAANAQTAVAPQMTELVRTERKVRVVLLSPYGQTDTRLTATKSTQPSPALGTEPASGAAGAPDAQASKAITFSQPFQPSPVNAPAAPQARDASAKLFKNVGGQSLESVRHDLNMASLVDLNGLQGGGNIGRAIIAGRPYRSSDELVTRRILSRAAYERIKAQVSVRP